MGIEHEWRQEYEQCRYLREITEERLKSRYNALIGNLWSTDARGNVTPPRNEGARRELLRLTVHTILEQMQREGTRYFDFSETKLREPASALYKPPQLRYPFRGSPSCFAKFGKRKHIHDAFNRGVLRIAPANVYDDPSLNTAQADKELEHYCVTPNEQLMFRLMGLNSEGKEVELPVKRKELFRYLMVQNFYVWCCGFGYDARLFHDFEAESVLVVRDMEAFTKRFSKP